MFLDLPKPFWLECLEICLDSLDAGAAALGFCVRNGSRPVAVGKIAYKITEAGGCASRCACTCLDHELLAHVISKCFRGVRVQSYMVYADTNSAAQKVKCMLW